MGVDEDRAQRFFFFRFYRYVRFGSDEMSFFMITKIHSLIDVDCIENFKFVNLGFVFTNKCVTLFSCVELEIFYVSSRTFS